MSETTEPQKNQIIVDDNVNGDSHFFKISVRAWIAVLIVVTVCVMSIFRVEVIEPLYTLASMSVGWYFGQKLK